MQKQKQEKTKTKNQGGVRREREGRARARTRLACALGAKKVPPSYSRGRALRTAEISAQAQVLRYVGRVGVREAQVLSPSSVGYMYARRAMVQKSALRDPRAASRGRSRHELGHRRQDVRRRGAGTEALDCPLCWFWRARMLRRSCFVCNGRSDICLSHAQFREAQVLSSTRSDPSLRFLMTGVLNARGPSATVTPTTRRCSV